MRPCINFLQDELNHAITFRLELMDDEDIWLINEICCTLEALIAMISDSEVSTEEKQPKPICAFLEYTNLPTLTRGLLQTVED